MTNTAITEPAATSDEPSDARSRRRRGPWHERVEGLHVLKLVGDPYTMGRQHGELLRAQIPHGPIPYYRTYLERLMGRSGLGPLAPVAWPVIQRLIGDRVARSFPDYARDSIRGMAEGAGLDHQEVLEGCSLPDSLVWVASRVMQLKGVGPAMHHRLALGLGCTSAIAWDGATKDGKLLHARNLDYHGVDCWPNTAAVVFHEPDDGLRYVAVTAAGVLMGGITAMNEAGLTLTVHQHMFTDRAALGGVPIGCVGDLVMRQATSLDEAEAILRAHDPIGCWTYLIADGHRREVLCYEENPERKAVVRKDGEGGTFGYANIYLDDGLGASEKNLYGSYWRCNLGRHQRANQLLAERFGELDATAMASILADQGAGSSRISEAIGMLMTVGSVVFCPEDGLLWLGAGPAPTSHRPFVAFDLRAERYAPELGRLDGRAGGDHIDREAFDCYRDAYLAYVDRDDVEESRRLAERACQLHGDEPLFHCLAGLLALKLGDATKAFASFGRCLELGHDRPERISSFHLWRARAADLDGRREQGLLDYRAALGHHSDPPVAAAARQGLRRPFSRRRARNVDVDFTYVDVVTP